METQVTNSEQIPNQTEIKTYETPKPKRSISNITVISIAVFILLAISIVAFLYYQNQHLKQMLAKYVEPSSSPTTNNDPLASWKLYSSSLDNYEFKVPQEWAEIEHSPSFEHRVVFQSSDGLYKFTANAEDNKNKATGKEYSSLDEFIGLPYAVKALKVGGAEARQPLPKSGFENYNKVYFFSVDNKLILSLELLVGDGTKTDHRVTVESLQIGSSVFDKILSTYKTNPPKVSPVPLNLNPVASPSGKVCTLEAKVCPNGSSVGRTGPNCDFAPCPVTP